MSIFFGNQLVRGLPGSAIFCKSLFPRRGFGLFLVGSFFCVVLFSGIGGVVGFSGGSSKMWRARFS